MPTLKAQSGHINASPELFQMYAQHYYECRQSFVHDGFSPVPYFLLCRAIELALKSRHLKSKMRHIVKREYGHNLLKAYDELLEAEKILDDAEYATLQTASDIYDMPYKGFEYCTVYDAGRGFSNFPNLAVLNEVARKLVEP
jgi:hypothetical protein